MTFAAALGLQDLALFSLTVLVLNATPGVDLVYTVTQTLRHGVRGGLAAGAGISVGCLVHALAAAFGLAALMAASALAFDAVKWVGAAYLLWLSLGLLRSAMQRSADAGSQRDAAAASLPCRARNQSSSLSSGPNRLARSDARVPSVQCRDGFQGAAQRC